jgi:alkanesulfonate monooxygenase SsuD/methylene tetrahydromethanopterin reductase-like flavin-dependent oxidoreductase (luciferase family)
MKFGLSLPPFGDYANPRKLAAIAHEAEDLGWDGFFIWDHVFFDPTFHPIADTWVGLAAMAMSTTRLRIGPMVTPLARRRPWKLARETVSIDQLSDGRLTLGVGLGEPVQWDFGFFNEETDNKMRARKLDEGLEVLQGLWSAKPFSYSGEQYQIKEVTFRPPPVQQPRIPIWVGGNWDKTRPQERAARWDGYYPLKWGEKITVEEWRSLMAKVNAHRAAPDAPFDWVHGGALPLDEPKQAADIVQPYEAVGVTWWVEDVSPFRWGWKWEEQFTAEATALVDQHIRKGPPKL